MPELPEIEHLRATLEPQLVGRRVHEVRLGRRDVVHPQRSSRTPPDLLRGATITRLVRHGKQLAVVSDRGALICVHLGMSGQLRVLPHRKRLIDRRHVHCQWWLRSSPRGRAAGRLVFRDPRRFGGLWTFDSTADLDRIRWNRLGPDALTIRSPVLAKRLQHTNRPIKATLLDQAVVAGLGNIYVDEVLFAASVHPSSSTSGLPRPVTTRLAAAIRSILARAITAGGSTLRDYVDGQGVRGSYAPRHRVYGRGGEPCVNCGTTLTVLSISQRTTVACPRCQHLH